MDLRDQKLQLNKKLDADSQARLDDQIRYCESKYVVGEEFTQAELIQAATNCKDD